MGLGSSMELVFKAILDRSNLASGLKAIQGQVETFSNKIKGMGVFEALGESLGGGKIGGLMSTFGALAGVGAAVGAGFGVAMHAVDGFVHLIREAIGEYERFQMAQIMIARSLGSWDEATKKMEEFRKMSEELATPDLELAGAYRILRLIGGEASASAKNIRLIADASAAGRGEVTELARAFAIVEGAIKSGEGTGRFGMRLARMGVISFEAKAAIDSLAKTAGGTGQALAIFEGEWEKFTGMAEVKGRTFSGALVMIREAMEHLLRALATPIAGTLGNTLRDIADICEPLEPILDALGKVIGGLTLLVNGLTTGVANLLDVFMGLGESMGEESFAPFEKRMEKVEKRMGNLGRGARALFTGTMENTDDITKSRGADLSGVDTTAQEAGEKVKKLYEDIDNIRRKTAELSMSNEEKIASLQERQREAAVEVANLEKEKSERSQISKQGEALAEQNLQEAKKKELEIEQEIQTIVQNTIKEKQKAAEQEAKKAKEIYERIKEGQQKRDFSSATPVEKLKMNADERSKLESQRSDLLSQQNAVMDSKDAGETPQQSAENEAKLLELSRQIAEIDARIAENKGQEQDVKKSQTDDLKKAQNQTQDYNDKRLFSQLRQDYGNEEDNKKAIELEKQFHEARIKQLEDEAKQLEQMGDLGGAESTRLKAQQEKDAIKDLAYDKRVNKGTQTMDGGGQFAGSLAGSLLGIQYDNSGQEQIRHLGTIAELTKATNEAVKLVADNTGKPIVISRFT
jgi:hypothetical protein